MLFPKIIGNRNLQSTTVKKTLKAKRDALVRVSNSHVDSDEDEASHRAPFQETELYDVIPGRLAFTVHSSEEQTVSQIRLKDKTVYFFSCDLQDRYDPFCSDFGPVKLSVVYRFCNYLHEKMTNPRLAKRKLAYYCDNDSANCTNTAFLLGCYTMTHWGYTPEQAFAPFSHLSASPIVEFRDATFRPADFTISLLACFRGLQKAMAEGWYSHSQFDLDQYECWDDVFNGDLHEICPKFIAFRGPQSEKKEYVPSSTPEDYVKVFKEKGVTAVVRLNEKSSYDASRFTEQGIRHYDLFFEDCGVPPQSIIRQFLDICDKESGRVAVHCKAGLGRTGTMIALWLMNKLQWKATDCISWLRIVRPGCVIGAQQQFLKLVEAVKWDGNTPLLKTKLSAEHATKDAWALASAMVERDDKCHKMPDMSQGRTQRRRASDSGSLTSLKLRH